MELGNFIMNIKRIAIFCISLGAIFLFTTYRVSAEETESQVDHSTMDHSAQEEVNHSKMDAVHRRKWTIAKWVTAHLRK